MNIIFIPGQSDAISLAGFKFILSGISDLDFQLAHRNTPSTLDARNLRPEQPASEAEALLRRSRDLNKSPCPVTRMSSSEAEPSALSESRGFGMWLWGSHRTKFPGSDNPVLQNLAYWCEMFCQSFTLD